MEVQAEIDKIGSQERRGNANESESVEINTQIDKYGLRYHCSQSAQRGITYIIYLGCSVHQISHYTSDCQAKEAPLECMDSPG